MLLKKTLMKIALPAFVLVLLAFVAPLAEAMVCKGCVNDATASWDFASWEATPPHCSTEGGNEPCSCPDSQSTDCSHFVSCPFCLAPGIETSRVSVSPDDRARRLDVPESVSHYESPSFSLLRPPIV